MGLLTPCFVPRGKDFAPFKSCPQGIVLDKIDTCIKVITDMQAQASGFCQFLIKECAKSCPLDKKVRFLHSKKTCLVISFLDTFLLNYISGLLNYISCRN